MTFCPIPVAVTMQVTPTPWPTHEDRLAASAAFLEQIITNPKNDTWFTTHPGQVAARDALPTMGGEAKQTNPIRNPPQFFWGVFFGGGVELYVFTE